MIRATGQRRGMTLIEVMVVMAVLVVITAVAIPSLQGVLDLQQRGAAKELAQTYTWLVDEAALRNVTFRVAYNLDRGTWKIEVGDPDTLVFGSPEEREEYEEELRDKMSRYTQREIEEGVAEEELGEGEQARRQFEGLSDAAFTTAQSLPPGTRFAWVYTPQYAPDGARPSDDPPDDPEDEQIAYTYVFPDGSAEHTVIRIVDEDDEEDGYTVEVEPLTGRVSLSTDVVEPGQSMAWLPVEGPSLP